MIRPHLEPGERAKPAPDDCIRINIRVSKETHKKMAYLIPWGIRRNVVEAVLKLVLDAIERDGIVVAGAVMDGMFRLEPQYRERERRPFRPPVGAKDALSGTDEYRSFNPDPGDPKGEADVQAGGTQEGAEEEPKDSR